MTWAESPPDVIRDPKPQLAKPVEDSKTVSIYLSFKALNTQSSVNDECLWVLFSQFGPIVDVSIRQSVFDPHSNLQRGYAFVCFAPNQVGVDAALQAAVVLADAVVDGVRYNCEVSKSLKRRLGDSRAPVPATSGISSRQPSPQEVSSAVAPLMYTQQRPMTGSPHTYPSMPSMSPPFPQAGASPVYVMQMPPTSMHVGHIQSMMQPVSTATWPTRFVAGPQPVQQMPMGMPPRPPMSSSSGIPPQGQDRYGVPSQVVSNGDSSAFAASSYHHPAAANGTVAQMWTANPAASDVHQLPLHAQVQSQQQFYRTVPPQNEVQQQHMQHQQAQALQYNRGNAAITVPPRR